MSKWKKAPIMEIKTNVERRQMQNSFVRVEDIIRSGVSRSAAYRIMREHCQYTVVDSQGGRPYRVMSRIDLNRIRVSHIIAPKKRGNPSFKDREAQRERAKRRWEAKNE